MSNEPLIRQPTGIGETAVLPEGLFQMYAPKGIRYAFSMLRNRADAEETTQEAFCRLLTAHPEWNGNTATLESQFPPLFFTTIRNQCIDLIRKRSRRKQVALDVTNEPVTSAESSDQRELESKVTQLLEQLPETWADALKLKINGQLSYTEIAEVMEATHAQVRTWIYRARRQLEAELNKTGIQAYSND